VYAAHSVAEAVHYIIAVQKKLHVRQSP
jgi:hypothetical protein